MGAIGAPAAAVIAAGAQLAGTGATAYAQGRMNRKTRKWNEKMHDILRQESLSDWAMQNEYNSPTAQMQRFRDAGLNPNLIYGQTNEGATVRSAEAPAWNPRSPQFNIDAQPVLSAYYDIQLKEASLDNLRAQNTVLVQEAALKAANTANTTQQTSKSEFDLAMSTELRSTSLETAKANLRKIETDIDVILSANERAKVQQESNLKEAVQRVLTMRLQGIKTTEDTLTTRAERAKIQHAIESLQKDNELKQLDIDLKRKGVQPSDPLWTRVVARALEKYLDIQPTDSERRDQELENTRRKKLLNPGH